MWAGGNVRFAVGVSGAGPFTYQWQLNDTNLPNGIITTIAGLLVGGQLIAGDLTVEVPALFPALDVVIVAVGAVTHDAASGGVKVVEKWPSVERKTG